MSIIGACRSGRCFRYVSHDAQDITFMEHLLFVMFLPGEGQLTDRNMEVGLVSLLRSAEVV